MNKYFIDLVRLWLYDYFKHPVENIRQANPIIPGRLYRNFGNICKAVPFTREERRFLDDAQAALLEAAKNVPDAATSGISPDGLIEMVRLSGGNLKSIEGVRIDTAKSDLPPKCYICDFHYKGIPCPIVNALKDSSCVCDSYRYVIIKQAPHV